MTLPGDFLVSDQVFWIVCGLFYLSDNIRPMKARQIVLVKGITGAWRPQFPLHGYRLAGRSVIVLNLVMPHLATVRMDWLTGDSEAPRNLRRTRRALRVCARRLLHFRALSAGLFVMFFIAAPFATHYVGLGYVLLFVLPLHVMALFLLIGLLVAKRRFFNLSWQRLSSLAFECAVCPGLFVNIGRRLSLAQAHIPGDGMAFVLAEGDRGVATRIGSRLEFLLDDLRENGEMASEDALIVESYRGRLTEVLGHE
jgi:hypothetical protein